MYSMSAAACDVYIPTGCRYLHMPAYECTYLAGIYVISGSCQKRELSKSSHGKHGVRQLGS